jgi:hypothetical protein
MIVFVVSQNSKWEPAAAVPCRACKAESVADETVPIRGVETALHRCPACGLRFFPQPDWMAETYEEPIADVDIGLASRCVNLAGVTEAVVRAEHLGGRRHLDYGGGYGLMTRLARDRGIDMLHHEPYAENLFAKGFEDAPEAGDYGCITLIEVFEHLTDPAEVLERLSRQTELVLISTMLIPPGTERVADWWYLLPDLGQHVTLYTERALAAIAARCGLRVTSDGRMVHVFHRRPLRPLTRAVLREVRLSPAIAPLLRLRDRSRTLRDRDGAEVLERFITERRAATAQRERAGAG